MSIDRLKLPNGMEMLDYGDVATIIDEVWFDECYQQQYKIQPGDVIIDIGANQGVFSIFAAAKSAKVFAVEPDPNNYSILLRNIEMNGLQDSIFPINKAVSSTTGAITLYVPERDGTALTGLITTTPVVSAMYQTMDVTSMRELTVPTLSFSELLKDVGDTEIDLLKIDVEGAELDILYSGKEEEFLGIKRLVMETHAGYSQRELCSRLADLGFTIQDYIKMSGVYDAGYLYAVNRHYFQESTAVAPVAVVQTNSFCREGDLVTANGGESFSPGSMDNALQYTWEVNGTLNSNTDNSSDVTFVADRVGLNKLSLTVSDHHLSDSQVSHFWVFSKAYGVCDSAPVEIPAPSDCEEYTIAGTRHFVVRKETAPKGWDAPHRYIKILMTSHISGDVFAQFDNKRFEFIEGLCVIEVPYFPSDCDMYFSVTSTVPAGLKLVWHASDVLETLPTKAIALATGDTYILPNNAQKYLCELNGKCLVRFDVGCFRGWQPKEFFLTIAKRLDDENAEQLSGEVFVNNRRIELTGWYQDIPIEHDDAFTTKELYITLPQSRTLELTWWNA